MRKKITWSYKTEEEALQAYRDTKARIDYYPQLPFYGESTNGEMFWFMKVEYY